jgi:mevalonate pyrophosphate decarboxylase
MKYNAPELQSYEDERKAKLKEFDRKYKEENSDFLAHQLFHSISVNYNKFNTKSVLKHCPYIKETDTVLVNKLVKQKLKKLMSELENELMTEYKNAKKK